MADFDRRLPSTRINVKHPIELAGRFVASFPYALFNGLLDDARYIEKADAAAQKRVDRDFIGRVQDRRREPPCPQAIEREIETRKTVVRRFLELQLSQLCQIQFARRCAYATRPR